MKIGCERCGASYSVADEKVAGRRLRLRCKKCGEAILIDKSTAEGAAVETIGENEPTPEGLSAPDQEADATWYVEIDGSAQGPFVFEEVAAQLEQGRITLDTLVYGVDFTDWRAASLVPELKARAVPPPVPAAAAITAKPRPSAQDREPTVEVPLASFGYSMGSDPFEEAENKPLPALSPRVSASEMMTVGLQREGTVQFSVDQIRALSSMSSPSVAPVAPITPKPGFASGDGSGLIDIRSLGEAPPEEGYRPLTGMLASPLDTMAPLTLPTSVQRSSGGIDLRTKVLAGLAALACVATGVVAALALTRQPAPAPLAATALAAAPVAASALPATAPAPAAAAEPAIEEPAAPAEPAAAAEPAAEEPAATAVAPRRSGGTGTRSKARAPRGGTEPAERAAAKAAPAPAKSERSTVDIDDLLSGKAPKAEKPKAKGGDSIDDLLDSAVSGKSAPAKPAAEPAAKNSGLPASPSRDEVGTAYKVAKAKTAKCKGPGVAKATVKFTGAGKVTSVSVSGVEGAAKSCVESALKSTTFPKSQKDVFEVQLPFALK